MGKKKYDPDKTFKEQQEDVELTWQGRICKIIRDNGGFAERIEFKLKGGCPDIIASMPTRIETLFIECKMGHQVLDPLQKRVFKNMISAGCEIRCICIYLEGDQIWFICFDFETGEEYARCQPNELVQMLWN